MNADIALRQTYSQEKSHYKRKEINTCSIHVFISHSIFFCVCVPAERVILSQQEVYPPSRSRPVLHK